MVRHGGGIPIMSLVAGAAGLFLVLTRERRSDLWVGIRMLCVLLIGYAVISTSMLSVSGAAF
jgi:hypothetical protein